MADIFSKAKRSAVMALIRSRGNRATELRLIALMRAHGVTGWRRSAPVFGKPDFVFRRERVAVFVDGCFWHGCPRHATMPESNRAFWKAKLARNAERDRAVTRTLRKAGWRVLRAWECALAPSRSGRTMARIARALEGGAKNARLNRPQGARAVPRRDGDGPAHARDRTAAGELYERVPLALQQGISPRESANNRVVASRAQQRAKGGLG